MDEKKDLKEQEQPSAPPKVRKIHTTLDDLPAGDAAYASQAVDTKAPLPAGVASPMLYKDVVRIAWPAFVELMLMQLTSMADLMMVGRLGPWAITAVGLTTQPKFLLSTAFIALNVGTMAMVGRYRGANQQEKAKAVLRQAFMLNGCLGLLFAIIGVLFSRQLVAFMGAQEEVVLNAGAQYLQIQMIGMFTVSLTTSITNSLRGSGDSKTAMFYNTTANVVNVICNYLLIYGKFGFPRLEVAGASLATVIGQATAMCIAIWAVRRKSQYVRLEFPKGSFLRFDKGIISNIAKIGVPSMVEQIAMRVGVIVFSKTIASLGTVAYATHQVCMNIQALTFMNGQAFATSATSLVSQSLGKGRPDMALHYSRRTQRVGMGISILIAMFVFFCHRFVLGLYTDDATIIATGSSLLTMIAFIQPFQSTQFIFAGALRGAGDTKFTAMVTMITVMLVRPGLALLLIHKFGFDLHGAWYALVVDQILRTMLIVMRYRSGKWTTSFKHTPTKS